MVNPTSNDEIRRAISKCGNSEIRTPVIVAIPPFIPCAVFWFMMIVISVHSTLTRKNLVGTLFVASKLKKPLVPETNSMIVDQLVRLRES